MALDNIAIDDGCMAGLKLGRNLILGLYRRQVLNIFDPGGVPILLQIFNPATTATSGGGPEDGELERVSYNGRVHRLASLRLRAGTRGQPEQPEEYRYERKDTSHHFFSWCHVLFDGLKGYRII